MKLFNTMQEEAAYNNFDKDLQNLYAAQQLVSTRYVEKSLDEIINNVEDQMQECLSQEAQDYIIMMTEFYSEAGIECDVIESADTRQIVELIKWHHSLPINLVGAYLGSYEDEMEKIEAITSSEHRRLWVFEKIRSHEPKQHTETYLDWVGIMGYNESIWQIVNMTTVGD